MKLGSMFDGIGDAMWAAKSIVEVEQ